MTIYHILASDTWYVCKNSNTYRETENDTTHARPHPNDARIRSESEDEHGDRKGTARKMIRMRVCGCLPTYSAPSIMG